MFRWQCIYEETSVCLSISITLCSCLSFSHSPSIQNLRPLYFSLSWPSSRCSLTLIVVVLVPFFKPSKSVSYQTLYYMRTDPGSPASQRDSTSGACQPPQASRSQISILILNQTQPRYPSPLYPHPPMCFKQPV